ncbi:MAG: C40 family peptidase [Flavobacteriales bacterium]
MFAIIFTCIALLGFATTGGFSVPSGSYVTISTTDPDSCAVEVVADTIAAVPTFSVDSMIQRVLRNGEKLLGKPYRVTGYAAWPLDCSGYVCYLLGKESITMPRTSGGMSTMGTTVSLQDAQPGDLLFFKGRNASSSRVGHVAMVHSNNNGMITMIHSCNHGIVKEVLQHEKYFSSRLISCKRPDYAGMRKK